MTRRPFEANPVGIVPEREEPKSPTDWRHADASRGTLLQGRLSAGSSHPERLRSWGQKAPTGGEIARSYASESLATRGLESSESIAPKDVETRGRHRRGLSGDGLHRKGSEEGCQPPVRERLHLFGSFRIQELEAVNPERKEISAPKESCTGENPRCSKFSRGEVGTKSGHVRRTLAQRLGQEERAR